MTLGGMRSLCLSLLMSIDPDLIRFPDLQGIAYELALAGATVYATARSTGTGDCTEGK